jgi:hypothetical protein
VKGVWVTVGLSWNNNYSTNIYTDIYCGLVSCTVVLLAAAGVPCLVLRLLLGAPQRCWLVSGRRRNVSESAQWNARTRGGQLAAVLEDSSWCLAQVWAEALAAFPAAELGVVGMVLPHGKRDVELADGLWHWVLGGLIAASGLSLLHYCSFRCQAAQPCSQTMLLLSDEQSDVYFLLIVSSECC